MNVQRLRQETRAEHEATEALVPLMNAALTRELYAEVLASMGTAVRGWEAWAEGHAPQHLAAMVRERRRSGLIGDDLRFLGETSSFSHGGSSAELDRFLLQGDAQEREARFLGAMYVMEGSTLGGQYIARHVEEVLGFTPGVGDAYFRGYGEHTGAMWNAFKVVLLALSDHQTDNVITSAKAMFAYFGEAMRASAVS